MVGIQNQAALIHGDLGDVQGLGHVGDVLQISGAGSAADGGGDIGNLIQQVLVHSLGNGTHCGRDQLRGEVLDIQGQLLGGNAEGHVAVTVDLHRHAALGSVLPGDGAGEVLGGELGGLTDGDSVADLGELVRVVTVNQIRHDQIVLQYNQGLAGNDVGGQKSVGHI